MVAVAVVIENPWAGQGFVDDLHSTILELAPPLGEIMVPDLLDTIGGVDKVEAYGKAAVVGLNDKVEHGSGLIHTLRFGNQYRVVVDGQAFLSFTNKRAGAGTAITIPMMHKDDAARQGSLYFPGLGVHRHGVTNMRKTEGSCCTGNCSGL